MTRTDGLEARGGQQSSLRVWNNSDHFVFPSGPLERTDLVDRLEPLVGCTL